MHPKTEELYETNEGHFPITYRILVLEVFCYELSYYLIIV
jgi:hypothetical protein